MPVWVRVTALDASGNPVWNYSNGNLVLSSVDLAANVPIPASAFDRDGDAQVQVTFTTANPAATLTVTDTSATNPLPAVTSAPINVAAAPVAASLAINTPAKAIVGVPVWVRVTALDASGKPVPGYSNGNLVLSSVDLAANVPIPASAFDRDGDAQVQVTFTTANPAATLTVTDTTATNPLPAVTSAPINVAAAPVATSLAIKTPANAFVGVPVWVKVTVLDASGKPMQNYSNGNLVLSSVDLAANVPIPASAFDRDGDAQVQVTFTTVDPAATLTVTDTSATNPLPAVTSSPINVAAAPVAASLAIKTPVIAIVGVPVWVRVTALDASGDPVPGYSNGNLVLSSVDLAANVPIPASAFDRDGDAEVQVTFTTADSAATLTVTDTSATNPLPAVTSSPIKVLAALPPPPWLGPSGEPGQQV